LKLEMTPVALATVIENGISSLAPLWEEKGIEVRFANRAPSDRMLGDESRLQQIVWNLISNAIKFTPRGGKIEVSLQSEGHQFVLGVKDSGEGISPEFMPFLFDRFRQADSTSTRRHGGLGLGLSIVRHLCEMHGGTVQACSEGIGHGATFSVRLPQMPRSKTPNGTASRSRRALGWRGRCQSNFARRLECFIGRRRRRRPRLSRYGAASIRRAGDDGGIG
jgi:signal transduction histidine kinase